MNVNKEDLLSSENIEYKYINIYEDSKSLALMKEKSAKTVPQIFDDDKYMKL